MLSSPHEASLTAIVSDACNVYWVTLPSFSDSEPPAVYALAR